MARTPHPMNRIRELREAAGLEQAELAARAGVTTQQVGRHERGERRLTIQLIQRYAQALEVTAADILGVPELAFGASDVEPALVEGVPGLGHLPSILAQRQIRLYRVLTSLVTDSGVRVGDVITVDESEAGRLGTKPGDVVLASVSGVVRVLRVFVSPTQIVTHMPGPRNSVLRLDDRTSDIRILGRMIVPDADGTVP